MQTADVLLWLSGVQAIGLAFECDIKWSKTIFGTLALIFLWKLVFYVYLGWQEI